MEPNGKMTGRLQIGNVDGLERRKQFIKGNIDDLVKSPKMSHCERSEAI